MRSKYKGYCSAIVQTWYVICLSVCGPQFIFHQVCVGGGLMELGGLAMKKRWGTWILLVSGRVLPVNGHNG